LITNFWRRVWVSFSRQLILFKTASLLSVPRKIEAALILSTQWMLLEFSCACFILVNTTSFCSHHCKLDPEFTLWLGSSTLDLSMRIKVTFR